jgi:hypothetical protein
VQYSILRLHHAAAVKFRTGVEPSAARRMNPYRQRSEGTWALEHGMRRSPPENAADTVPYHEPASKAPFETANLRPVVSRFGGMVMESSAVHIPAQASSVSVGAADNDNDFESRCKPEVTNVYAGIPGYAGYRPQGSHPNVLGTNAAPAERAAPRAALDTSKQPYIMPVVGYSGHIRGLADADKNYGTSHWKNSGNVTGHKAAASLPWDGRDVTGRPFGGWAPSDGGVQSADPEYDQKKREAEEAMEILELRSMGIRALMAKKPELGGSRGR